MNFERKVIRYLHKNLDKLKKKKTQQNNRTKLPSKQKNEQE